MANKASNKLGVYDVRRQVSIIVLIEVAKFVSSTSVLNYEFKLFLFSNGIMELKSIF